MSATPSWFHREVSAGMTGPDVVVIQRITGASPTGVYDVWTEQRVAGVQRRHHLHATGVVDEDTAAVVGETLVADLVPQWFHRPLHLGSEGPDVVALRSLVGCTFSDEFDDDCEQAVRRWQSAHRIVPDGLVSETMATGLGDA